MEEHKLLLMAELLDLLSKDVIAFRHCKFFGGCRNFMVPIHGCAGANTQLNSMTGSMPCIRKYAKLTSVYTLEVEVDYFLNGFSPKTVV